MFSSSITCDIFHQGTELVQFMNISAVDGGFMLRYTLSIIMFFSMIQSISWGADKAPVFTQKDFAHLIVQQYSWSDGLPKDPADRDYLTILGGRRSFRYEAENAYNERTDLVSVKDTELLGPFTGKGWIQGVSNTTYSNFTILLPISGEYDLKGVIKGSGFVWTIDGKEYLADSKSKKFQETEVARIKLKAGLITIRLTIPPEGAIDSFSLTASDLPSIQPFLGWRFKEGLTAARLAETLVAMTNRFALLPDVPQVDSPKPLDVSEKVVLPSTASLTTANYLGPYSSAKWIRADYRGATLQIPLTVAETGYYGVSVNAMGDSVSGKINDISFRLPAKPYLDKVNLGLYRLEAGDNAFTITLSPAGGIDSVGFNRKSTKPEDFMLLAGVNGPFDRLISQDEASRLLKLIQGSLSVRN